MLNPLDVCIFSLLLHDYSIPALEWGRIIMMIFKALKRENCFLNFIFHDINSPGKEWDIKLPGGGLNAPLAQAEVMNAPPLASPWLQCLIKKKMGVFLLAQKGNSSDMSNRILMIRTRLPSSYPINRL